MRQFVDPRHVGYGHIGALRGTSRITPIFRGTRCQYTVGDPYVVTRDYVRHNVANLGLPPGTYDMIWGRDKVYHIYDVYEDLPLFQRQGVLDVLPESEKYAVVPYAVGSIDDAIAFLQDYERYRISAYQIQRWDTRIDNPPWIIEINRLYTGIVDSYIADSRTLVCEIPEFGVQTRVELGVPDLEAMHRRGQLYGSEVKLFSIEAGISHLVFGGLNESSSG